MPPVPDSMQSMALKNIVRNALNPSYLPVMVQKLKLRLLNRVEDEGARRQSTEWCEDNAEDLSLLAGQLDRQLWAEAQRFAQELADRGERRLGTLKTSLGRGGYYPLLYFLTRYRKPRVIVETGVAAGFSSAAFLAAIRANGSGHLFSSDFPLFRLERPERYVGRLVDDDLHQFWTLFLRGDRKNLRQFFARLPAWISSTMIQTRPIPAAPSRSLSSSTGSPPTRSR